MKARLTAYAGYQVRDFFAGRLVFLILATAAAAWAYGVAHGLTVELFDAAGGLEARDQLERAFEFVAVTFAFVAAAIAAQGLVARHRARGYDRVVFSRRLNPVRYYMQGFVLAGAASVAVAMAASQIYAAVVHPVSAIGVAGLVALSWFTIGGSAFLLSTLTRFHVAPLVLLVGADLALDRFSSGARASGVAANLLAGVQYLFPPAHAIAALREPFVRGLVIDPRSVAWPIAHGLVCLVLSVILLRRRPLGS